MDNSEYEMTIETLKQKLESQAGLIREMTKENEELFHQYNHLIIRNSKLLKRVDDYQKIIADLHIRIEELQLISSNQMHLNDRLRIMSTPSPLNENRMTDSEQQPKEIVHDFDLDDLYSRWRNFPGQVAQNEPNLRKQVLMLACLYQSPALSANELFRLSGVGGVTGARYVSTLKKFDLIKYTGARKKGKYVITSGGLDFVKESRKINPDKRSETAF